MPDSRWRLDAVLFGKTFVFAEVIDFSLKMAEVYFGLKGQ